MDNQKINADSLPLEIREHLMRGENELAIEKLAQNFGQSQDGANQLIEDYRAGLRERKVTLDIQIMNEQNQRETLDLRHQLFKWGVRGLLFVIVIAVSYLMVGT